MTGKTTRNVISQTIHDHTWQTLSLSHRAVSVRKQQAFQADNFFPQLSDLTRQRVVLSRKQFHLGLQIGEPLFLPLTTFERSNSVCHG